MINTDNFHFESTDPDEDILKLSMDDDYHHITAGHYIIPHTWPKKEQSKKKIEIIKRMKITIQRYLGAKYS